MNIDRFLSWGEERKNKHSSIKIITTSYALTLLVRVGMIITAYLEGPVSVLARDDHERVSSKHACAVR
ncbi:hypothetical protein CY34DRAFT_427645 [Suillus luteus UH-Slu-Lm8-n1]|uniref:Uncharacterized protein n=1 Tax=Suillus luteus UH-Slu-Lm8-n1 TaxID=930992 RepID=A0A0D0AI44_9AGAM|nr:hypothetical protein CY34DRAFT_427645 [Suillus luteus UH-Slu-Lm8-n1]